MPVSVPRTLSNFAAQLPPFISGELADAALGGDAASTNDLENPLLMFPTKGNLLAVVPDGVPVKALILVVTPP